MRFEAASLFQDCYKMRRSFVKLSAKILLFSLVNGLLNDKTFILGDPPRDIKYIAVYGDSLLCTAFNDIVQRDMETDFGITQILSDSIIASRLFNVANLRGLSIHYAAPEAFSNFRFKQFSKGDLKKYDIYSFACVILELFNRKTPWK